MSETECVVCGRPTPDGYACVAETERARRQLLGDERCDDKPGIVDLVGPARDVAYRQTTGDSIAHGAPGPRDLLDYGAGAKLDAVQNALTGWARVVADERGSAVWVAMNGEIISQAAHWLAGNLEWLRHKDYVDDVLREIGDCLHAMRSVVATPAGRVYLGACGAMTPECKVCQATNVDHHRECDVTCPHKFVPGPKCDGDVYGRPGAATGKCRTCGAEHDQEPRKTDMQKRLDGRGFRASEIAHAYGISVDTIRGWAFERRDGKGELIREPKLKPAGRDELNRPLYLVADVLQLDRQARQRREQKAAQAAGMGA